MRLLSISVAAAALAAACPAHAQYFYGSYGGYSVRCNQIGSYSSCNGSDGSRLQQNTIGNSTYTNYSSPYGSTRCTTRIIGNSVFSNCD